MRQGTENIEWHDVQGLVLSGYPKLRYSAFILWRFLPDQSKQRSAAKAWLKELAGRLMRADSVDEEAEPRTGAGDDAPRALTSLKAMKVQQAGGIWAINLALTVQGLDWLGVGSPEIDHFSPEFRDGMTPLPNGGAVPRRCNVLGDVGDNSPELWHWGGWKTNRDIDGVLLLYAATKSSLQALVDAETQAMQGAAAPISSVPSQTVGPPILKGRVFHDNKEHFGFKDGISQPIIDGSTRAKEMRRKNLKEGRISVVKAGEFILGYRNERKVAVSFNGHAAEAPPGADAAGAPPKDRDLGRNGTYLVFRQLEQDVPAFNSFVAQAARRVHGQATPETEEWVASRLIGRRPSGEPLIGPSADSSKDPDSRNDFLFHFEDRHGLTCPIGSHIRRANPRDTIGPDPDTALRLSKMHRIIRRGRPYGERLSRSPDAAPKHRPEAPRGIYFICLNADIAGQFELIQHSWLNNVHFGGLYAGADPLSHFRAGGDVMTIQRRPMNLHLDDLKPFVKVRGGAYFFLPGIKALQGLVQ